MNPEQKIFDVMIIGGGPAGIDMAMQLIDIQPQPRICIIDSKPNLGGNIAEYHVNSNSKASNLTDGIDLSQYTDHSSAQELVEIDNNPTKLTLLGTFYKDALGGKLEQELPKDALLTKTTVSKVIYDKEKETYAAITQNQDRSPTAKSVIMATGGEEPILAELEIHRDKTVTSKEVFTEEKLSKIKDELDKLFFMQRRIVVVGNASGAWSSIHKMLEDFGDKLPEKGIEVLTRNPTRVYFKTVENAESENYAYTEDDINPITKKVHNYNGILYDAKETYLRVTSNKENRVRIICANNISDAEEELNQATIIVQATGLTTNIVPIYDINETHIGPFNINRRVQTDPNARLLDHEQKPLNRAYGIGIGYYPTRLDIDTMYLHGIYDYRKFVAPIIVAQFAPKQEKVYP